MLGKLLKHEFKANAKMYIPLIIVFTIISVMMRIMTVISDNIDELPISLMVTFGFLSMIFFMGMFALCFYSILGSTSRFQKNLFTDEGYLMHTLPVPSHYHIFTKLIIGVVWFVINVIVCILCLFIGFMEASDITEFATVISDMAEGIAYAFREYPGEALLTLLLMVATYCAFILLCYTSTALSSFFNKGKGFITTLLIIGAIIANNIITSIAVELAVRLELDLTPTTALIICTLYFALIAVGLFFAVNSIMSKKLNLE